jgi:AcrR family transcriptional regulator
VYVCDTVPETPRRSDAQRLPSGRHGLSREEVARNQRDRIVLAVAEAVAAVGYAAMTVEDIVARAGLSRRTFYEHFRGGKEEAFLASFDAGVARLLERVQAAYDAAPTLEDRLADALNAFLTFVAGEPAFALMCVVQVLAAGPRALERRDAALRMFVALIADAERELPQARRPPPLTAETIVGGIYEIVYSRILAGQAASLPGLLPALLYSALVPYVGHEAALAEYRRRLIS